MSRWIVEELREYDQNERHHAASKARTDVRDILVGAGYRQIPFTFAQDRNVGTLRKLWLHVKLRDEWGRALGEPRWGDVVVFQYPMHYQTLLFGKVLADLRKRGILTVLVIHDVQSIRNAVVSANTKGALRARVEEAHSLKQAGRIVVHNQRMAELLQRDFDVPAARIVCLGLFDYVCDKNLEHLATTDAHGPVVIAGNLTPQKAGYVYKLPSDVRFRLYGPGYEGKTSINVDYAGSFPPELLPSKLAGSFGLVWDGPEASSCTGTYGEYLRVNNPHKASLYLASGLPVVTWSKAAVGEFVQEHGVGIVVDSLNDLHDALASVTPDAYEQMCSRARQLSRDLNAGHYLLHAMETV